MRHSLRPEVPSIVRGHPRTCVNRCRSRSRSRVFPRRSGPRRPFTHGSQNFAFAKLQGYRELDPRPCPPPRLALFTRDADERFSGSGYRPTTSATDFPTRGHTPEHPIFAFRAAPALGGGAESALASPCVFRARRPSPLEEGSRALRTATALPRSTRRTLQARRKARPRKLSSDGNAACGRRLDPTTVCGDGRWTTALDCTGRVAPSEGPAARRLLPQNDDGEGSPPQTSSSSTPGCHRLFARWAGCSRRPHEPTKARVPASPREGQRVPESRDAFHHQES
jgi:hypothetical protein